MFEQLAIFLPFIILMIVMIVGALNVKKTAERPGGLERLTRFFFGISVAIVLMFAIVVSFLQMPIQWLDMVIVPTSLVSQSIGFTIEVIGLAFAIWARVVLGHNWSTGATIKEQQELIRSGPYAIVRHPIYTGLLTMFFGIAIYLGYLGCLLGLVLLFFAVIAKAKSEETLMLKHFPVEYVDYKEKTKALIPFIY